MIDLAKGPLTGAASAVPVNNQTLGVCEIKKKELSFFSGAFCRWQAAGGRCVFGLGSLCVGTNWSPQLQRAVGGSRRGCKGEDLIVFRVRVEVRAWGMCVRVCWRHHSGVELRRMGL